MSSLPNHFNQLPRPNPEPHRSSVFGELVTTWNRKPVSSVGTVRKPQLDWRELNRRTWISPETKRKEEIVIHWRAAQELDNTQLSDVLTSLELLTHSQEWFPPTEYAITRLLRVVPVAYLTLQSNDPLEHAHLPKPFVSTDDIGGIRMRWRKSGRDLRINVGAESERQSYVYYESGQAHGIQELEMSNLVERFHWLIQG